ncbi:heme NO-binding domain-containing protein [Marinoscillum pacificum]|uniref:heme NO-binding domain-containing protein n=1 Tax=Marinoscillum pacificum TaxID=392723 RepID=UPI002157A30D|nr:heme NO-binding domain-containing protein [Marinoscillum pacificum]
MKGTIHYCLEETIIKYHGEDAWTQVTKGAGLGEDFSYGTKIRDDIDEVQSIELFVLSANIIGIELSQLFDEFGEHWCVEYSPKVYGVFYRGMNSTKEAVTKLDRVHETVTNHIPNAYPPRFVYNWKADNVLELFYKSDRNLIDLFISLVKGLNKKFGDYTEIEKKSEHIVLLTFHQEVPEYLIENQLQAQKA